MVFSPANTASARAEASMGKAASRSPLAVSKTSACPLTTAAALEPSGESAVFSGALGSVQLRQGRKPADKS